jgi:hypothetical protein
MVGVTDPKTGKFVKGNKAGGRKSRPAEERYLERFKACVSVEDVDEIILKAVQGAKRGDPADRKFIFDYLVGPPVQKSEIGGADGGPLRVVVEYANDTA